jgi:glycosyltransferase involved in cell wall biosynthesis
VFPSRTDTFGLVMLEALASGVPVAAYPVTGPIDVIRDGEVGCLRERLADAIDGALRLDRARCREYALGFRWENATREFLGNLVEARGRVPARRRPAWRPAEPAARRRAP